jgi:hypothetical protein
MTDISWEEIREFYSDKKTKWSNTTSYYGARTTLWGNEKSHGHPSGYYGFELLPAYSEEEVQVYERKMRIHLPDDLRSYLTLVSRELHTASYPMVFKLLENPEKWEDNDPRLQKSFGSCHLPSSMNIWDHQRCLNHLSGSGVCPDECFDEDHDNEEDDPCGGMKTISNGGCTDEDYIVLRGNDVGCIWTNGGGGDSLFREKKTFHEFVTKSIKWERGDRPPAASLVDTARMYNFLRIITGGGALHYTN